MRQILLFTLFILVLPPLSFLTFHFLLKRPSVLHSDSIRLPVLTLFGAHSVYGLRPSNEDAHLVSKTQNQLTSAVFDGHSGPAAASFCKRNLRSELYDDYWALRLDYRFLLDAQLRGKQDGCTATVVVLARNSIKTYNIGDSRAILARAGCCLELSHDAKPSTEYQRIYAAGGVVQPMSFIQNSVIVYQGPSRIYPGGLAVSRAIGDLQFKNINELRKIGCSASLVTAYPELSEILLSEEDHFVVIACDGLFDVFTSEQTTKIAYILLFLLYSKSNYAKSLLLALGVTQETKRRENPAQTLASLLCRFALKAGSTDNVTVILNVFEEQFLRCFDVERIVYQMTLDSRTCFNYISVIGQFEDLSDEIAIRPAESIGKVKFWRLDDDPVFKIDEIDDYRQILWREFLQNGVTMSKLRTTPEMTGFITPKDDVDFEVVKYV